ncbi:MAG: TetR/AcrR family transcriptional regulator [Clostridiales bacterium]|nr:TetR/AcrR family transcriptional regulator [Clostridiales bacterium]
MKHISQALKQRNKELNDITLESITKALIILMKYKSYNSITITDICIKAGVSRNAFYKNFGTKENVFRLIVKDFNKNIILRKLGNPFNKKAGLDWYVKFFYIVKEHAELFKLLMASDFTSVYLDYVNSILTPANIEDVETKYSRLIWNGAIQNVAVEWLRNGMKESPNQLAKYCYKRLDFNKNN